jgi:hypothetical protein
MTPAEIDALLHRVTPDLDAMAAPWTVIGSAALILLGAPVGEAADLDVVTSAEGAGRLRTAWADWLCRGEPRAPDGPFWSEDFARYETPRGPVEVMGGLHVQGEPLFIGELRGGLSIPSAADQLRILHLFGRPKDLAKAARLEAWLAAA